MPQKRTLFKITESTWELLCVYMQVIGLICSQYGPQNWLKSYLDLSLDQRPVPTTILYERVI